MTDVEIYDRAVFGYLRQATEKVEYAQTGIARNRIAKLKTPEDKVPWAFVSYYRDPTFEFDPSRDNFRARTFGELVKSLRDSTTITNTYVHTLPINLTYNVDVWAGKNSVCQELAVKVLNLLAFRDRVLEAAMNPDGEAARFDIIDVEWVDNSDLEQEEDTGKIYRHTLSFTLDAVVKLSRSVTRLPFTLSEIPVDIYEGDDIDGQICS